MFHAAVIGLGNIGLMYDLDSNRVKPSTHVIAYAMNANIGYVSAFDTRIEQKTLLNQMVPEAVFSQSMKALFEQSPVDVVSICTPPQYHLDNIKEVLKYGNPKVIFCEKPIIADFNEFKELESLLYDRKIVLVPNLSRRWSRGTDIIRHNIQQKTYGQLLKVHARYTRGIHNTGSHLFDLLKLFAGNMEWVKVIHQVNTSADLDHDPTYSFIFNTDQNVQGHVEGFNDQHYYMFEIDLYFECGKIEFRMSGDSITVFGTDQHPLFTGFSHLYEIERFDHLLSESNMANAVKHLIEIMKLERKPMCTLKDGIYPINVAQSIIQSADSANQEVSVNSLQ